jgi:hypothetical protein
VSYPTDYMDPSDVQSMNRDARQRLVRVWAIAAFGKDEATSVPQRGVRMLEEAIEAAQAAGVTADMAHELVTYVFGRPTGELVQELGGLAVTTLLLAEAALMSADIAECTEISRVLAKPVEHFALRNAAKNAAGFKADE